MQRHHSYIFIPLICNLLFSHPISTALISIPCAADSTRKADEKAGSVDLDRRLDRTSDIINVKDFAPAETLSPADIDIFYEQKTVDVSTGPTLTLKGGIIQKITLDKDTYEQGEVAQLNIYARVPIDDVKINFLYKTYPVYRVQEGAYKTTLAVPMTTDEGEYTMTLRYQEKGEDKKLEMPVTITLAYFSEADTAELDVPVMTEETMEMLRYEHSYFAKAYRTNPDSLFYEGAFIWPCAGSVTGLYGTPRKYNDEMDEWSHKAVDIANAVGAKVYAANNGVIAMSENLDVHGRSIVIAHGGGVHTVYLHLDSLCVKKGDKVKKGQLIGRLGKTGLCTGPNLHWQVMVNRVPVNPRYWLDGKPEIKAKTWVTPDRSGK